jgi:hypothetical protein
MVRRAIWVLGLLLLGLVGLSAARANEADDPGAIRAHRKAIFQILVKRTENVRHRPPAGMVVSVS